MILLVVLVVAFCSKVLLNVWHFVLLLHDGEVLSDALFVHLAGNHSEQVLVSPDCELRSGIRPEQSLQQLDGKVRSNMRLFHHFDQGLLYLLRYLVEHSLLH